VLTVHNLLTLRFNISLNLLINLVGNNNDVLETEATKGCLTHSLTDKHVLINRGLLPWRRMKEGGVGGV
jgi:hypothetical protein